ncbi:Cullin-associated NEDD8-dissociated protein 1 [Porphyridium purpureum]|uniref:Cullin-associated NEDD8-dissociated protein 1 n=1 Tax=Porphyridium purpureum TaxID=35688 RepID=A0A5J4Z7X3_PORPP|nr:Cullin-associated NEDD8-dissociated protein 1 [Porphyridium purpureum]|eukprot:POR5572..scf295_1
MAGSAMFSVSAVLEKMGNADPDLRYMAVSDLLNELSSSAPAAGATPGATAALPAGSRISGGGGVRIDAYAQKQLMNALFKLQRDSSSEVQGLAIKCLAPLCRLASAQLKEEIIELLCAGLLGKGQHATRDAALDASSGLKSARDVAALGLKLIVTDISPADESAAVVSNRVLPHLLAGIQQTEQMVEAVKAECLDILQEVLQRFSSLVGSFHEQVLTVLLPETKHLRPLLRKRAVQCIAAVCATCSEPMFAHVLTSFQGTLHDVLSHQAGTVRADALTTLYLFAQISKTCTSRLAPFVDTLVPALMQMAGDAEHGTRGDDDDEENIEMRELALSVLSTLLSTHAQLMSAHADVLARVVSSSLAYDPNFIGNDDEDDENIGMEAVQAPPGRSEGGGDEDNDDGDEEEDDDDDEVYGDDDDDEDETDSSWKVRRAAVRCAAAFVCSHMQSWPAVYETIGQPLIRRLCEREQVVMVEILQALQVLFNKVEEASLPAAVDIGSIHGHGDGHAVGAREVRKKYLMPRMSWIMRKLQPQLVAQNAPTRIEAVRLLKAVTSMFPDMVCAPLTATANRAALHVSLLDQNAPLLRSEVLSVLQAYFSLAKSPDSSVLSAYAADMQTCMSDRYYKVAADAFSSTAIVVVTLPNAALVLPDSLTFLDQALDLCLKRMSGVDEDSEVRESAIYCAQSIVPRLMTLPLAQQEQEQFAPKYDLVMQSLVARLQVVGGPSKIAVLRALKVLCGTCPRVFEPHSHIVFALAVQSLRISTPDRVLLEVTMELLVQVTESVPVDMTDELAKPIFQNMQGILADQAQDLRLIALCFELCATLLRKHFRPLLGEFTGTVWPLVTSLLVSSSSLPESMAATVGPVLQILCEQNQPPLGSQEVLDSLWRLYSTAHSLRKSQALVLAKCIALSAQYSDTAKQQHLVSTLLSQLDFDAGGVTGADSSVQGIEPSKASFVFVCLGEIGKSGGQGALLCEPARARILTALQGASDELKSVAACALGGIELGLGLPGLEHLLSLIKSQAQMRYLLLMSLKELVSSSSQSSVDDQVSLVLPVLIETAMKTSAPQTNQQQPSSGEKDVSMASSAAATTSATQSGDVQASSESIRAMAAECLGMLAKHAPTSVLPEIESCAKASEEGMRDTAVIAMRLACTGSAASSSEFVQCVQRRLPTFLSLLSDPCLSVRRHAMLFVTILVRYMWSLLDAHEDRILSAFRQGAQVDKTLIREVNLGPFKYVEDDGLELRKATFECMILYLSRQPGLRARQEIAALAATTGLTDQPDVRTLAESCIISIALSSSRVCLVPHTADMVAGFGASLAAKQKANAVRQEVERHEDAMRSTLRAIAVLEVKVLEMLAQPTFSAFLAEKVKAGPAQMYAEIVAAERGLDGRGSAAQGVSRGRA